MVALLAGLIIGTAGIGGVLLAPALIIVAGIGPHQAAAVSLISFTFAGLASAALHLRNSELPHATTRNLAIGLLPGAFIGGWLSGRIPDVVVLCALLAIGLFSAGWTLAQAFASRGEAEADRLSVAVGGPVGLLAGFGSAVTGTSGPVLLTPALIALRFPAWRAIAVGQVIQVIVAPAGAFGYLVHVRPNLTLTATVGTATAAGCAIGICGARRLRLPARFLYMLIAVLLAGTSVVVGVKLAARLLARPPRRPAASAGTRMNQVCCNILQ